MSDVAQWHRQALQDTRRVVGGVTSEQWELPTPNQEWNVRELLNHVVVGNYWVPELVRGRSIDEVGDRYDGDVLGSDPVAAYDESAGAAAAAFEAPGALDAPCGVSYGPVPGSVYAGHRFIDVLVHGWDLATATGQDTALNPGLVAACLEVVTPQADLLRDSGAFATDVEAPPDADPQTTLLALLGRKA
jgi:uncharacterized protein (TIGR03086 family)